jgi:RND family efflux transporter MFP subunit
MTRYRRVVLSLVAAAGAGCGACSRPDAHAAVQPTDDLPIVAVARATRGDIGRDLTIAAEFRPYQEIDVHAKVAGYLKSITVDVGDRVKEGQLLAVLEVPELQDQLQQDEAGVKRAHEEVNRVQADLERAESAHEVAHLAAGRLATVMKTRPNLIAQQDIDEAVGRDRVAEAQVSTAKAAAAGAREQLEVVKADQNKTRTLLAYSRISAPFSGVITHRYADTGAMIQAGTSSQTQTMPIVRLSQNTLLRLIIPLPESAVGRIHPGSPVAIRVQTLGRTWSGTVARAADRLDAETRTMRVEVDVPNPQLELVPGMYAEASVSLDHATGVVTVPVQAIDRGDKAAKVLLVTSDHRLVERPVALGLEAPDRVEIASGLQPDDLVVIGSRAQLKAGMMVVPKIVTPGRTEDPQ